MFSKCGIIVTQYSHRVLLDTKEVSIMNCKVGSIRQIHQQLKQDGYQVSEYALRTWIKTEEIPAKRSGKKALVLYSDVLAFLNGTSASA